SGGEPTGCPCARPPGRSRRHLPFPAMPNFDQSDAAPGGPETLPEPLPADPLPLFEAWFDEALERRLQPNPNAMTVATLGPQGELSARIVLCKAIDTTTGH